MKESNILLIDISAKIPYGLKCNCGRNTYDILGVYYTLNDEMEWEYMVSLNGFTKPVSIKSIKPYLRSMSSMTEEEAKEIAILYGIKDILSVKVTSDYIEIIIDDGVCSTETRTIWYDEIISSIEIFDWLNVHYFDYRIIYDEDKKEWMSMIEKGLAIEVTEENNPYKVEE